MAYLKNKKEYVRAYVSFMILIEKQYLEMLWEIFLPSILPSRYLIHQPASNERTADIVRNGSISSYSFCYIL